MILSMAPGCQSHSQSPTVARDMRAVHGSPQNPRLSALAKLSNRAERENAHYLSTLPNGTNGGFTNGPNGSKVYIHGTAEVCEEENR